MAKYHVNPATGTIGKCTALTGQCPYGGDTGTDNHYSSKREAEQAAEQVISAKTTRKKLNKPNTTTGQDSVHNTIQTSDTQQDHQNTNTNTQDTQHTTTSASPSIGYII